MLQGNFTLEVASAAQADLGQYIQRRYAVPQAGWQVGQLQQCLCFEPQHVAQVGVAARECTLLEVGNAHCGGFKQQLLFAQCVGEQRLAATLFINVVDDPDGTFQRSLWVDQVTAQAGPEKMTIATAHAALRLEGFTLHHAGIGGTPQCFELFARGVQVGTAHAGNLLWIGKPENLGKVRVAANHSPVFDECDAYARTAEQRLLFA